MPTPAPAPAARAEPPHETLYLIGRPTLKDYLKWVRGHAVHPSDEGTLAEQWEGARRLVRTLEHAEAGRADGAPIGQLGPAYEPLLERLLQDPLIRHGFNTVPTEIGLVDLERLVVYQKHIDLTHVRRRVQQLSAVPTAAELFRICLPFDHPQPPARWSRMKGDKFVFISPSNDLRFLGTMSLDPENITGYPPPGDLVGVVGIAVGFGSNFLNALRVEGRLILRNGSHRAYALKRLGVTHVPCIIQHVSSRAELEVVASTEIRRDPDLYLKHPRPPMLVDYFRSELHAVMPVHHRNHIVTVSFEVDQNVVPAL